MPINIKGKEYVTVAERVLAVHELKKLDITTEVLAHEPNVIIKATVVTDKGTFTGISAANPLKPIEKMSPYEVAETSAVGRALGFAGFGVVDSIATADEMTKAEKVDNIDEKLSAAQVGKLGALANRELGWGNMKLAKYVGERYGVANITLLTKTQASDLIKNLMEMVEMESDNA